MISSRKRYMVMTIKRNLKNEPGQPAIYEIRIKGHLGPNWENYFENLTIKQEEDGDTLLIGPVVDQSALHGLLKKVRDLGMPLVSIIQVQFNETHPYRSTKENET